MKLRDNRIQQNNDHASNNSLFCSNFGYLSFPKYLVINYISKVTQNFTSVRCKIWCFYFLFFFVTNFFFEIYLTSLELIRQTCKRQKVQEKEKNMCMQNKQLIKIKYRKVYPAKKLRKNIAAIVLNLKTFIFIQRHRLRLLFVHSVCLKSRGSQVSEKNLCVDSQKGTIFVLWKLCKINQNY